MTYQNLEVECNGAVATIWLNRPQVRNALDEVLIAELTHVFSAVQEDDRIRVLVLAGRGTAFCAGGDLQWMRRMAEFSAEQNLQDAMRLARMLKAVHASRKPVVARVHGPAYAGGMGLAAACDVIVADPAAEFCLSEVRIGLVPATISPYVIRALGLQATRRYMLTAERLEPQEAWRIGFVHELTETGAIDQAVTRIASALLAAGPQALTTTKALIARVGTRSVDADLIQETATCIAHARASREGREGVMAFLAKRKPAWTCT
jgi:methylglutaconyl-CoA hydratase